MPNGEIRDKLARDVGPHRSTSQVLGSVAGAPVTVLSTFEFAVNSATPTSNSLDQAASSPGSEVTSQVAQLSNALNQLQAAQASSLAALGANTLALAQNTAAKSSGDISATETIGGIASNIFGGGLLSSVIGGLVGLFGGSRSSTPAPLVKFALPPIVNYEGGQAGGPGGPVAPVDYGQSGHPRTAVQSSPAQVNIQVNAMDSKSFLDHSDEIAQAVKKAILNSSSLNDVISDL